MANLPPGYYTSAAFIGTVLAFSIANMSNYAGCVDPGIYLGSLGHAFTTC